MNISDLNLNILTTNAIAALRKAHEECSDSAAKESIFNAADVIIRLHHDLGKYVSQDSIIENDSEYDPSEYCTAV